MCVGVLMLAYALAYEQGLLCLLPTHQDACRNGDVDNAERDVDRDLMAD